MTSGLARFGRPTALTCNLGISGALPGHTPGSAYSGTFTVTNRVGNVTAELVSATPALPAGWALSVNQGTGVVTLAWPGTSGGSLVNSVPNAGSAELYSSFNTPFFEDLGPALPGGARTVVVRFTFSAASMDYTALRDGVPIGGFTVPAGSFGTPLCWSFDVTGATSFVIRRTSGAGSRIGDFLWSANAPEVEFPGAGFGGGAAAVLPNLDFEAGSANWLLGNAWVIDTTALVETGAQSAKYNGPGQSTLAHAQAVPVTPGQTITASARISKGTNREDFGGGAVVLQWLDAAGVPISFAVGNVVNTGSSAFQTSSVTATAPAGAALVRLAVSGTRDVKGRARDKVYVDNVAWNHTYATGGGSGSYAVVIRVRDGRGCQATLSQTISPRDLAVVSLLHMDGTNGSTSFPDDVGKTWTANGNAQVSTAWSRFGSGSLLLDGNGDWIQTASNPDFNFGTGDFTIEAVVRPSSLANNFNSIFANGTTSYSSPSRFFLLYGNASPIPAQQRRFGIGGFSLGSDQALILSSVQATVGTSYHVAVTRAGDTLRLFVDGVLQGSANVSGISFNFSDTNTRIGANGWDGVAGNFSGNIDEVRVIKGRAEWTANFTPPASAYTF